MKQHKTHAHYVYALGGETATLEQLNKQLADIQGQLASLTAAQANSTQSAAATSTHSGEGQRVGKPERTPPSAPQPGYCFRCGEDRHIRTHFEKPPNSALVAAKKKQFAEKQGKWRRSNLLSYQS